ncbi:MAG: hypothetical protein UY67_C0038G0008 [Candidatus Kaiserbacteria bacterium GW2011_GWA2_52_12]|uniref:Uncharacterized protein n=1 Tax=Candidatus Kaiserbacteria bacterium GW2011_GWA2_52_12 TaxID=1618671 RepID=A0A0G1ZT07_9BACT|nr:MAG: hypothetical protein UY67_C0038G0008 [Candidatus Kaiserbacteria bacterium GW2011_GWA2_52_12]
MLIPNDQPAYPLREEPEGSYRRVGTFIPVVYQNGVVSQACVDRSIMVRKTL